MTPSSPKVGIIGAGLSGLMAGRILQDRGVSVTLMDKARRPGGRANTREHGRFRFDHGAQFFTVRDPDIRGFLQTWMDEGVVAEWTGSLVRINNGRVEEAKDAVRYVGVPGMVSLASRLAEELDVRVNTRVEELRSEDAGWTLLASNRKEIDRFDTVLVAVPAPQAVDILSPAPELRTRIAEVEMAPCWAGMYVFPQPLALGFDGAFLSGGALSWIARDSSKPRRPGDEAWVLHAGPEWSRENLAMDRDEAAKALLREFQQAFGSVPDPGFQRAHRWAFALASDPTPYGAFFHVERRIGACGDWCVGGRIEGALLSGMAAANQILASGVTGEPSDP